MRFKAGTLMMMVAVAGLVGCGSEERSGSSTGATTTETGATATTPTDTSATTTAPGDG